MFVSGPVASYLQLKMILDFTFQMCLVIMTDGKYVVEAVFQLVNQSWISMSGRLRLNGKERGNFNFLTLNETLLVTLCVRRGGGSAEGVEGR